MADKIKLEYTALLKYWIEFLENCDEDTLARLTGELFGGELEITEGTDEYGWFTYVYTFIPNENYQGAFEGE